MEQGVASSGLGPLRTKKQRGSDSVGLYTDRESVSSIILNHQQSEIGLSYPDGTTQDRARCRA